MMLRVQHPFHQPRRQEDRQHSISSTFGKRRDDTIARDSRHNKSSSTVLDRCNQIKNQSQNSVRELDSIIVSDTNELDTDTPVG